MFQRSATISTKLVKGKDQEENAQKFNQYFDWSAQNKSASH